MCRSKIDLRTGANLRQYWSRWRPISPFISKVLREGVDLQWENFKDFKKKKSPPYFNHSKIELNYLDYEISQFIKSKAVVRVGRKEGKKIYQLPISTVPKKNGERRFILDARSINEFLKPVPFKMHTIKTVKQIVEKNDFFTKVDLKSAFTQVPLSRLSQKYLKFKHR